MMPLILLLLVACAPAPAANTVYIINITLTLPDGTTVYSTQTVTPAPVYTFSVPPNIYYRIKARLLTDTVATPVSIDFTFPHCTLTITATPNIIVKFQPANGDVNHDGTADVYDLVAIATARNYQLEYDYAFDLQIDLLDLALASKYFEVP